MSPAVRHWIQERFASVLLIPLVFWFVWMVLPQMLKGPTAISQFLASPLQGTLALLWTLLIFWRGFLEMQTVIEDYIPHLRLRTFLISCCRWASFGGASIGCWQIVKVMSG